MRSVGGVIAFRSEGTRGSIAAVTRELRGWNDNGPGITQTPRHRYRSTDVKALTIKKMSLSSFRSTANPSVGTLKNGKSSSPTRRSTSHCTTFHERARPSFRDEGKISRFLAARTQFHAYSRNFVKNVKYAATSVRVFVRLLGFSRYLLELYRGLERVVRTFSFDFLRPLKIPRLVCENCRVAEREVAR